MAITPVAKQVMKLNKAQTVTFESKSAAFGADAENGDYKTVILFNNEGSAATATIAVGNGLPGAGEDLTINLPAGITAITLDSGYFKFVSAEGANADYRGCYKITPSAAVKVAVLELPQ